MSVIVEKVEYMVEFCGEISGECLNFVKKKLKVFYDILAIIVVFVIFIIPTIILSFLYSFLLLIFLVMTPVFILFFSRVDIGVSTLLPLKIEISYEAVEMESEMGKRMRPLDDIKKVIDYGDWYVIKFNNPKKDRFFICQKNLLVKGNLEDFERLFNGKIIRKTV